MTSPSQPIRRVVRAVAVAALFLAPGATPASAQLFDPFRPAPTPAPAAAPAPAPAATVLPAREARETRRQPNRTWRRARATRSPASPAESPTPPKTLTLVAGEPGSAALDMAADLSASVSDERLRVLTLLGGGGSRTLSDVIGTKGVDMGVVTTLDLREAEGTETNKHVVAIAKLDTMALHVLARDEIRHLTDLDGRTVNLGEEGSSTQAMGRALLKAFGIRYTEANLGQRQAIERMRAGETIAASLALSGKPAPLYAGLTRESGLHFLELPYEQNLDPLFFPATLGPADYPGLIGKDETVGAIAVTAALVAIDWDPGSERYRRLSAFTTALFDRFEGLQEPGRHPRWRDVNLAADLPGWRRFKPAREILEQRRQAAAE